MNSTATGMSAPTSAPNRAWVGAWWLRYTPGCRVITSPSSTDIRAISSRRWRRSAVASSGVAVPARAAVKIRSASLWSSGVVSTSVWLWSAETAPCAMKCRRRSSSAAMKPL